MRLHKIFGRVAIKRLSRVEISPGVSHQHEMNGVRALMDIFGRVSGKKRFPAKLLYLSDSDDMEADFPVEVRVSGENDYVTWYDAREKNPDRTEYRLYYSSSLFIELADEGDLLVVGFDGESVWMLVAAAGSTIENQILWLFAGGRGPEDYTSFRIADVPEHPDILAGIEKTLLESLGMEIETETCIDPEKIIHDFGGEFPQTRTFSAYARESTGIETSLGDPDSVLLKWWNCEEELFRILEKHIVEERIGQGFHDVDDFTGFALSVLNRRKSRAGHAFENHLEQIFIDHGLEYSRGKKTEGHSRPDFVFPSIETYHASRNREELTRYLTVLGAKTTCKDRWRQVTKEAELVKRKHLVTLEPAISENQTDEMKAFHVQLVVPEGIFPSYGKGQQEWLMCIADFLEYVLDRQREIRKVL